MPPKKKSSGPKTKSARQLKRNEDIEDDEPLSDVENLDEEFDNIDVDIEDDIDDEEIDDEPDEEGANEEDGDNDDAEDGDDVKDVEEKCLYKFAKMNDEDEDNDDEDEDDEDFVFLDDDKDDKDDKNSEQVYRSSKPFLTKYEWVRLISDRAKALSLAAKPMLNNVEGMSPKEIAEYELTYAIKNKTRIFPYKLRRKMPNDKIEVWYVDELQYNFT